MTPQEYLELILRDSAYCNVQVESQAIEPDYPYWVNLEDNAEEVIECD